MQNRTKLVFEGAYISEIKYEELVAIIVGFAYFKTQSILVINI